MRAILLFRFDKKWLKNKKHCDEDKVKNDKSLSDKEREVILGIHKRHLSFAVVPSQTDFAFLAGCYKKSKSACTTYNVYSHY